MKMPTPNNLLDQDKKTKSVMFKAHFYSIKSGMMAYGKFLIVFLLLSGCNPVNRSKDDKNYKSENLIIQKVSDHVYQHISFLQTESFGNVPCNGMIVFDENEAIIFDTPVGDSASLELISWIEEQLNCEVKAVVPTHFHADCVDGLDVFHKDKIPSYANNLTIDLARSVDSPVPQNGFTNRQEFEIGSKKVIAEFTGEGHTKDNIIGYFPDEKIMFGGCLIKEMGADKGNLEDANVNNWSSTVAKLKEKYPDVRTVIPGHGKAGGSELLDYTIQLFRK